MFDSMFKLVEQQRADGSVDRPEFEIAQGSNMIALEPDEREAMEAFVIDKTTAAHSYVSALGRKGVVYYDQRGRGAQSVVEELPDAELVWLAKQKGWKSQGGEGSDLGYPHPVGDADPGYPQPVEEGALTEGLMSRKKLYDALKELSAKGIKVEIPSSYKKLSNEIFGREAMIFVGWGSPADKLAGERALKDMGFKAQRYDVKTASMIQVTYFKGWHWDEDLEADVTRVLSEARAGTDGQKQYQLGSRAGMAVVQVVLNNWKKRPKDIKGWLKLAAEYDDVPRHIGAQWMSGFKGSLIGQRMMEADGAGALSEELHEGVNLHHFIASVAGLNKGVMDLSDYSGIDMGAYRSVVIALASRVGTELTHRPAVTINDPNGIIDYILDNRAVDLRKEIRATVEFEASHSAYLDYQAEPGEGAVAAAWKWTTDQIRRAKIDIKKAGKSRWTISMRPTWKALMGRMWKEGRFNAKYEAVEDAAVVSEGGNLSEQIEIIHPYGANMWVIRFEDYLYKVTKKKWTWKKPILRNGSDELHYKWIGRKTKGKFIPPTIRLVIKYDRGHDLFDVTVAEFDADVQKVREKHMRGMYIEDVTDPDKMLGWMRR